MKLKSFQPPRFLALWLILCLGLPTSASALRPQGVDDPDGTARSGMEEALRQSSGKGNPSSNFSEALAFLAAEKYQQGKLAQLDPEFESMGLDRPSVQQQLEREAEQIVREKIQGKDFRLLTDKGGLMLVYHSVPDLPGIVVKVAKPGVNFERRVLPGYQLAKERLGDLFVTMIVQDLDVTIDGEPHHYDYAVVQEEVEEVEKMLDMLQRRISSLRRGKLKGTVKQLERRYSGATRRLQEKLLELSREIWKRGVVDTDVILAWRKNYGIVRKSNRLVAFDADKFVTVEELLQKLPELAVFNILGFPEEDQWLQEHFTLPEIERLWSEGKQKDIQPIRVPDVFESDIRKAHVSLLLKLFGQAKAGMEEVFSKPFDAVSHLLRNPGEGTFYEQMSALAQAGRLVDKSTAPITFSQWQPFFNAASALDALQSAVTRASLNTALAKDPEDFAMAIQAVGEPPVFEAGLALVQKAGITHGSLNESFAGGYPEGFVKAILESGKNPAAFEAGLALAQKADLSGDSINEGFVQDPLGFWDAILSIGEKPAAFEAGLALAQKVLTDRPGKAFSIPPEGFTLLAILAIGENPVAFETLIQTTVGLSRFWLSRAFNADPEGFAKTIREIGENPAAFKAGLTLLQKGGFGSGWFMKFFDYSPQVFAKTIRGIGENPAAFEAGLALAQKVLTDRAGKAFSIPPEGFTLLAILAIGENPVAFEAGLALVQKAGITHGSLNESFAGGYPEGFVKAILESGKNLAAFEAGLALATKAQLVPEVLRRIFQVDPRRLPDTLAILSGRQTPPGGDLEAFVGTTRLFYGKVPAELAVGSQQFVKMWIWEGLHDGRSESELAIELEGRILPGLDALEDFADLPMQGAEFSLDPSSPGNAERIAQSVFFSEVLIPTDLRPSEGNEMRVLPAPMPTLYLMLLMHFKSGLIDPRTNWAFTVQDPLDQETFFLLAPLLFGMGLIPDGVRFDAPLEGDAISIANAYQSYIGQTLDRDGKLLDTTQTYLSLLSPEWIPYVIRRLREVAPESEYTEEILFTDVLRFQLEWLAYGSQGGFERLGKRPAGEMGRVYGEVKKSLNGFYQELRDEGGEPLLTAAEIGLLMGGRDPFDRSGYGTPFKLDQVQTRPVLEKLRGYFLTHVGRDNPHSLVAYQELVKEGLQQLRRTYDHLHPGVESLFEGVFLSGLPPVPAAGMEEMDRRAFLRVLASGIAQLGSLDPQVGALADHALRAANPSALPTLTGVRAGWPARAAARHSRSGRVWAEFLMKVEDVKRSGYAGVPTPMVQKEITEIAGLVQKAHRDSDKFIRKLSPGSPDRQRMVQDIRAHYLQWYEKFMPEAVEVPNWLRAASDDQLADALIRGSGEFLRNIFTKAEEFRALLGNIYDRRVSGDERRSTEQARREPAEAAQGRTELQMNARAGEALGGLKLESARETGRAHILYNEAGLAALFFLHDRGASPSPNVAVVDPLRHEQMRAIAEAARKKAGWTPAQIARWDSIYVVEYTPGDRERGIGWATQEAERRISERLPGVPPLLIFTLPRALSEFGAKLRALLDSFGLSFQSGTLADQVMQALYKAAQA